MFKITGIPAFNDNYIWVIHNDKHAIVVDPGDSPPVLEYLNANGLTLTGILCTHRHHDHVGGIEKLRAVYSVPVYGRAHEKNPHISHDLHEKDKLVLDEFDLAFRILEVPGHLVDHIAYFAEVQNVGILFCGDVLFGAGCGRNFEGPVSHLRDSLQRLAKLPATTQVYCAHEYTASNLRFAAACEPGNAEVQQRVQVTAMRRAANLPTVPFTIAQELATNPFLRCNSPEIIHTLQSRGLPHTSELDVFTALREWRNNF